MRLYTHIIIFTYVQISVSVPVSVCNVFYSLSLRFFLPCNVYVCRFNLGLNHAS